MRTDEFMAGLRKWLNQCNRHNRAHYLDFIVGEQVVGAVHRERAALLAAYPRVFMLGEYAVRLSPRLATPQARTEAVAEVLQDWRGQGILNAWRGEPYQVAAGFHDPPCMLIERAAATWFGIRKYGVHLNGLSWRDGALHMWLGRRSRHSPTFPGQLDQLVAGGLTAGLSPGEVLRKECAEEAAIPPALASQARPVGIVGYSLERQRMLSRDTLFIYDLVLPETFVPRNTDGEVEAFYLWPIEQVAEAVADGGEFKFNCNLVIIDFLVRHGYLCPEDSGYVEIVAGLRGNCR
jgi:8-oxo-dGTP pyrophosphatase MutT (NUDIX family)